jgi:hypothetical protein
MFPCLWKPVLAIFVTQLSTSVIYLPSFVSIGKLFWLLNPGPLWVSHPISATGQITPEHKTDSKILKYSLRLRWKFQDQWFICDIHCVSFILLYYLSSIWSTVLWQQCLHQDSLSGVDSNSDSPSNNTVSWRSYPATDARKNSWLAVAGPTLGRRANLQSPGRRSQTAAAGVLPAFIRRVLP